MSKFKSGGIEYTIPPITFGFAITELKANFNIDLMSLFEGNNSDVFMQSMMLSDDLPLKLWWFYVGVCKQKDPTEFDTYVSTLTREELEGFKKAFWEEIDSFFDPTRRELVRTIRTEFSKLVIEEINERLKTKSTDSSSST